MSLQQLEKLNRGEGKQAFRDGVLFDAKMKLIVTRDALKAIARIPRRITDIALEIVGDFYVCSGPLNQHIGQPIMF